MSKTSTGYPFLGIFISILFLQSALSLSAQNETYTWNSVAIGGGGFVSGLVTSKTEAGLLYARTDVGGAYRFDSQNEKWIPLLDWVSENELGYLGVESIAIDPVDAAKVYMLVGTSYFNNGRTAILRSSDYGNTYQVTEVSSQFKAHGNGMGRQTGEKLQVDPNMPEVLYCGTRANGLFKSLNSGVTWNRMNGLNITSTANANGISFVLLDPSSASPGNQSQIILAGISRTGSNLFISTDAGVTFTEITGGPVDLMPHRGVLTTERDVIITYANKEGPWNIDGAGAIWKYSLENATWSNISPIGFNGSYGGISVDPANPLRIVASSINTYQAQDGSWGDRIFLSTDGGANWVDVVSRGFQRDENNVSWVEGHAIHWAGSIEFDPFDPKKVWVISGNGVFKTDDIDAAPSIWKFNVAGLEETVPLDLVSIPNGPLVSVIGDYDGFIHSDVSNYAPIHKPQMGTTTGIAVASLDRNKILRVGEKMYYSEDRGTTWEEVAKEGATGNVAISADGTTWVYSPDASSTTVVKHRDAGTWTQSSGLTLSNARVVADPVNASKFYSYNSATGVLYRSVTGATSFGQAGSPGVGGSKIIRAAPFREGDLWVALQNGGLTRSVNSGDTFTKISAVTTCSAIGFGKNSPGKDFPAIFIWGTVGGTLGMHRSDDQGVTWQRINDDAHEYGGPGNGQFVVGDMNVYGRAYMSTAGRGIVFGESSSTCIPASIEGRVEVDGNPTISPYVVVSSQSKISLIAEGPEAGTYKWTGPDNFASSARELYIEDPGPSAGLYQVTYTDIEGCESAPLAFFIKPDLKVSSIIVRGENGLSTIDERSGSLQMTAEVLPQNASNRTVLWSIGNESNAATITSDGMLTALENGEVVVRATATDGSAVFGEKLITITNQIITSAEISGAEAFGIYPNPASAALHFSKPEGIEEIEIRDLKGARQKYFLRTDFRDVIDVTDLSPGIYIMTIRDVRTQLTVVRIVKL